MKYIDVVPELQVLNRLRFDNPWWGESKIADYYSKMRPRVYFDLFSPYVTQDTIKRAVILMGPRRVGKTVMLYHMIQKLIDSGVNPKKICYLSIETPIYNHYSLERLFELCRKAVGDNEEKGYYIFFDEIQYLKEWEIHLKTLVDSFLETKFVVSGSAAAALKLQSAESGVGRFTHFVLPPLTFHEYITLLNLEFEIIAEKDAEETGGVLGFTARNINKLNEHFFNYINFGGYPEVIFSPEIQADPGQYIKNDIIDKVLSRDLPSLYGISDIQELNYLFNTLSFNTGNEVSLETLSRNSGVAKNTIKKYITYLEAAFLIKVVHRIGLVKKFQRANFFKIYLTNPSLRCALFSPITQNDQMAGNLVETAIYSQWQHSSNSELHYARWEGGEVDVVCTHNLKPVWAVEIKWSDRIVNNIEELSSVKKLCETYKQLKSEACITTKTITTSKQLGDIKLEFVPASLYCYAVGYNLVTNKKKQIEKALRQGSNSGAMQEVQEELLF